MCTGEDDLVMDFFSGSGTTAQAVMELNAEDGGHRHFLLVQLPEACAPDSDAYQAGFRSICDIGRKRIDRAAEQVCGGDTGYRVYQIGRVARNDSESAYACLAVCGLPLSLHLDCRMMEGVSVWLGADNSLTACFAEELPEKALRRMAELHPRFAVVRENAREQAERVFAAASPETTLHVL
jgi:adenine-specific DNA-methyltransferase